MLGDWIVNFKLSKNSLAFSAKLRIRGWSSCSLALADSKMGWLTAAPSFLFSDHISQPLKRWKDLASACLSIEYFFLVELCTVDKRINSGQLNYRYSLNTHFPVCTIAVNIGSVISIEYRIRRRAMKKVL